MYSTSRTAQGLGNTDLCTLCTLIVYPERGMGTRLEPSVYSGFSTLVYPVYPYFPTIAREVIFVTGKKIGWVGATGCTGYTRVHR
jgi:hypothetical protein